MAEEPEHRRLVIVGSGIAGLTAAIYGARANNDPLVLEGDEPGGQLTLTTEVDNYPGFPEGISGPDLVDRMKEQATRFGAEIRHGIVDTIDADDRPFELSLTNGATITADAVIAASGASARTLDIPGEDELMGYGVSTCATCDGAFFRGEEMLVVGGGDAAMEEATFLTRFAEKVTLVHRREEFRAEAYWVDRLHEKVEAGDIEVRKNTELVEIHGSEADGIDRVTLVHHPEGHPTEKLDDPETERYDLDVGAVFLAIGHTPNTEYLEDTQVELDDTGYAITQGGRGANQTATDEPGLFAAGDVVDFHYQQAVTAGGLGSMAALDADEYLETELDADASEQPAVAPDQSDD